MSIEPEPPCVDADGSIRRRWIVIKEPARIPDTKGPFNSGDEVEAFLIELYDHYERPVDFIILELTWDYQLWTQSGSQLLTELALAAIGRLKAPEQRAMRSLEPSREWQRFGKPGKPNKSFFNLPRPRLATFDDCGKARLSALGVEVCRILRRS